MAASALRRRWSGDGASVTRRISSSRTLHSCLLGTRGFADCGRCRGAWDVSAVVGRATATEGVDARAVSHLREASPLRMKPCTLSAVCGRCHSPCICCRTVLSACLKRSILNGSGVCEGRDAACSVRFFDCSFTMRMFSLAWFLGVSPCRRSASRSLDTGYSNECMVPPACCHDVPRGMLLSLPSQLDALQALPPRPDPRLPSECARARGFPCTLASASRPTDPWTDRPTACE
mmetsp:Transcript_70747/g.167830  ORF Transcript_70747/g.167830 Transcript_70747/m.167830 type:complete len:233 (-) Transcript_70747:18-716(-)